MGKSIRKNDLFTDGQGSMGKSIRKSDHFTDGWDSRDKCIRKNDHFTDGGMGTVETGLPDQDSKFASTADL